MNSCQSKETVSHDIFFDKKLWSYLTNDFLSTDLKLYKGVEITVHCICAAAVKLSVESDVESLVSRYEKHLKVDRQLEQENAEDEMEISENGPLLQNADKILKQAMNAYWKETTQSGEWHFIRRKEEIVSSNSKVIDRLLKKKSKFGFMDKLILELITFHLTKFASAHSSNFSHINPSML